MAQDEHIRPEERVSRDAQRLLAEYFRIRREYNSMDRNDPAHAPRRAELKERYFALDRQYTDLIQARAAIDQPTTAARPRSRADVLWEGAFADNEPAGDIEPVDTRWIEINTPAEGRATDEIFEEALRRSSLEEERVETSPHLEAPGHDLLSSEETSIVPDSYLKEIAEEFPSDAETPTEESAGSLGHLDRPNLSAVNALRDIAAGLKEEEPITPPEDDEIQRRMGTDEVSEAALTVVAPLAPSRPALAPPTRVAHARGDFRPRKRGAKSTEKEISCPSCGESLPAGTRVCTYCHARLFEGEPGDGEAVRHITQTNLQAPKAHEKPGIGPKVIITGGWFLVLLGATWLIFRGAGVEREQIDAWLEAARLGAIGEPQAGTILGVSMVVLGIAVVGLGIFAGRFVRLVIPMHELARSGRIDTIEKLILQGEDIDLRDERGCTPLHFAVVARQREAVAVLVGNGADPNSHNDRGDTPLHLATANRDDALVQYLLSKGADAEAVNDSGSSLTHVAAWVGDVGLLRMFLDRGLSIEARTKVGFTPLHFAAQSGYDDATVFLIERGAQVDAASNLGTTPLFAAVRNGHLPVVQRLVDAGADVNVRRAHDHKTPLGIAAAHDRDEVFEFLKARGATES